MGYRHLEPATREGIKGSRLLDPIRAWRVNCALFPEFVPDGRLLDIGCASGAALDAMHRIGWRDLHGIEFVPEAAARARARGFDVKTGPVESMLDEYPDGSFDVIFSTMVLEHLTDPFAVVSTIARKLKPGGQFLFSTITRDTWELAWYKEYWAGFDFPRHMVFLSHGEIESMLARDYEGISFHHQAAPVDFVRSSSWRGSRLDRALVRAGSLVAYPLALFSAASRSSTRISVRCRKRARPAEVPR